MVRPARGYRHPVLRRTAATQVIVNHVVLSSHSRQDGIPLFQVTIYLPYHSESFTDYVGIRTTTDIYSSKIVHGAVGRMPTEPLPKKSQ